MASVGDVLGRGLDLLSKGQFEEAERSFRKVLRKEKRHFGALNLLAVALIQLKRYAEAEANLLAALAIDPKSEETLYNYGLALIGLNRHTEAVETFDRVLAVQPKNVQTLLNRAVALRAARRGEEALADLDLALSLDPSSAEAHSNRAGVLLDLLRYGEALTATENSLRYSLRFAEAWCVRAAVLDALKRHEEALQAYDAALRLNPNLSKAWFGRGNILHFHRREYASAAEAFSKVIDIDPDYELARGSRLHSRMFLSNWESYREEVQRITRSIEQGKISASQFVFLSISDSAAEQLKLARLLASKYPAAAPSKPHRTGAGDDKIRVGYVSADFGDHPTAVLAAGLFEHHDRSRFEVTAFSLLPRGSSPMRARLAASFDHFVDASELNAEQTAALIRKHEIDIAIDLMGFTEGERMMTYRFRPAPIQVGFLGYPGTTGVDFIDYLIADQTVIPPEQASAYSENVVYLPDSYQPNDDKRPHPRPQGSRAAHGLPESGFVYCCFNNIYKVTPQTFDCWMRILMQVEGSILWLLQDHEEGQRNLRREAERRGISGDRLVFAPRVELINYLARFRLADLFLDTLPCNAHTTASDSLWMGVPVITQIGTTFAGRVAASLLRAAGLSELVTNSVQDYEKLAVELARDSVRLATIREKIERSRTACPLFDTARFTRHIEAAYTEMVARNQRGESPESFAVSLIS